MGALIFLDEGSATIFIGLLLALLVASKYDNLAFKLGFVGAGSIAVLAVLNGNPFHMIGALAVMAAAFADEVLSDQGDRMDGGTLSLVLKERPVLKVAVSSYAWWGRCPPYCTSSLSWASTLDTRSWNRSASQGGSAIEKVDVLVIGTGPAGAAASFFIPYLSEGKLSVLSLEKLGRNFDRYHHMCGEALSKKAFEDLAPLGPHAVQFQIRRAVEHWPGDVTIETEADGCIIDRPEFLRHLLGKARRKAVIRSRERPWRSPEARTASW